MSRVDSIKWMTESIARANRSRTFSVSGTLPDVDPLMELVGDGPIKLPLTPKLAKLLIASGKVAPYGKGTKTIVDRTVRNAYELSPSKIQLGEDWNAAIAKVVEDVAVRLGFHEDQLQATLYKVLLYERGGFFLPHRDSEKQERMIGSLVVLLPTAFSGGELIVRHESSRQTFTFPEASTATAANYVAFYADCEHEIRKVTRGRRLALTYNLSLRKARKARSSTPGSTDNESDTLARSIRSWIATRPGEPLVFALEHQYTERGLTVDLLKGADRSIAELVIAAAGKSDCKVHLAQVSRHLLQFADDGSFGRGRHWGYRRVDPAHLEIGETYEDELQGHWWVDTRGKRQKFGSLPLQTSAIISSVPLDDWKPSSEDYEGYTGNAGNTLDRWYHRSAIIVWHERDHFDVLARVGPESSLALFLSMVGHLAKTPKKRFAAARDDCLRLARAIIKRWPLRSSRVYARFGASNKHHDEPPFDDFSQALLALEDSGAIRELLSAVARRDKQTPLDKLLFQACHKHGVDTYLKEMTLLLAEDSKYDLGIAMRDLRWLYAVCCDRKLGKEHNHALRQLCSLATERFRESNSQPRRSHATDVKGLPLLVKALVATESDEALAQLIGEIRSAPDSFTLEHAQVPCLEVVVPWSRKRCGELPAALESWLAAVKSDLESTTQAAPEPPADWARPARVECNCKLCAQLNEFLRDPTAKQTRIAASEELRVHVSSNIKTYRCDTSHTLEKKGTPYSLILTKTTSSYERAVKQFATDVKLLKSIHSMFD